MQTDAAPPRSAVWRDLVAALDARVVSNGIVAFTFAGTAPIALVFAAAAKGNLGEAVLSAWIFGGFVLTAFLTIALSLYYRQPITLLWTMPGTVLVGHALTRLSMPEIVGAYLATGALILVLGLTGVVGRIMRAIPMPIVMGMVVGVFVHFALDGVHAFQIALPIALPMTVVFFALLAMPRLARRMPPLLGALIAGIVVTVLTGKGVPTSGAPLGLGIPALTAPVFTFSALAELTIPLAITVLAAQNGQGFAILSQAGHDPPVDQITVACGVGALAVAPFGTVPTCLAGPVSAILVEDIPPERQFAGAVVLAVLAMLFGLSAPILVRLSLAAPPGLIATLAGLAMLRILQGAFTTAFKGPHSFGALVSFIVTFAGLPLFNIGSPFWGLVFGYLASRLVDERV